MFIYCSSQKHDISRKTNDCPSQVSWLPYNNKHGVKFFLNWCVIHFFWNILILCMQYKMSCFSLCKETYSCHTISHQKQTINHQKQTKLLVLTRKTMAHHHNQFLYVLILWLETNDYSLLRLHSFCIHVTIVGHIQACQ